MDWKSVVWGFAKSFIRKALIAGATYLVTAGYFDQHAADQIVAALMTVIALGWDGVNAVSKEKLTQAAEVIKKNFN